MIYTLLNDQFFPRLQQVETTLLFQIPRFQIIGLPSQEVMESKERIRAAFHSEGIEFPRKKVIVNLSPSSIRKKGTTTDLAMALSILVQSKKFRPKALVSACGELGLNGSIRSEPHLFRAVYASWKQDMRCLILPREDQDRLKKMQDVLLHLKAIQNKNFPEIYLAGQLSEAWNIYQNLATLKKSSLKKKYNSISAFAYKTPPKNSNPNSNLLFLSREISNQILPIPYSVLRVLVASITGGHHLLVLGPKGAGKTHLTEWLRALLPETSEPFRTEQMLIQELDSTQTQKQSPYSILSNQSSSTNLIRWVGKDVRPYTLTGSIQNSEVIPGEFSRAHGGYLIADELPEWHRDAREALREPLERRTITVSRSHRSVHLPAHFKLFATGNLCPCGGTPSYTISSHFSSEDLTKCTCKESIKKSYIHRISGPLLDRIDILLLLRPDIENSKTLRKNRRAHPHKNYLLEVRKKILDAQKRIQMKWNCNSSEIHPSKLESKIQNTPEIKNWMDRQKFSSLRKRHKLFRLAITLSSLDFLDMPDSSHLMEAALYLPDSFQIKFSDLQTDSQLKESNTSETSL